MLYQQLRKVNELDAEITTLHGRLQSLYDERSHILRSAVPAVSATTQIKLLEPTAIYAALAASWLKHRVDLPAYKQLEPKLIKACQVVAAIERENPKYAGKGTIVAVPPYKIMKQLVGSTPGSKDQFGFTPAVRFETYKKIKRWSVVIILHPHCSVAAAKAIASSSLSNTLSYAGYDCQGMGVMELLAAEHQGLEIVIPNQWTILLKDTAPEAQYYCATLRSDSLIFDALKSQDLPANSYITPTVCIS